MRNAPTALLLLVALLAGACARPRSTSGAPRLEPLADAVAGPTVYQSGIASWYGADFHGRVTANGEIYDMRKLTAAHPSLPFHTLVEVENAGNGRRVLVRVNDRGPFLKGRIIDLSRAAAERLGMTEQGTAAVRLRVLRFGGAAAPPPSLPLDPASPAAAGGEEEGSAYVQAGAFGERRNAEDLLPELQDLFPGMNFRLTCEDGLFKLISAAAALPDCRRVVRELAARGLPGFIRRDDIRE